MLLTVSERRKLKATRKARGLEVLHAFLRVLWVAVVLWCEFGLYTLHCRWPDAGLHSADTHPVHVLLLADTQVRHPTAAASEATWAGWYRHRAFDSHLRRSWRVSMRLLKPHVVIFLGDMLAATTKFARSEAEYLKLSDKFHELFPKPRNTDEWYYLPGNNDIGLGGVSHGRVSSSSVGARLLYLKHFGPLNQNITIANHTLLLLNSPGLVEEDYARSAKTINYERWKPLPNKTLEYVTRYAAEADPNPLIVFSHIPFHRPDSASCGPLREKGTIRRGAGNGYQSTLGKQTTAHLLATLKPAAIFSADDRDYCEYSHRLRARSVKEDMTKVSELTKIREITVKSFSKALNIRRPGLQLLSLASPTPGKPSFSDTPCFFPDESTVYATVCWPAAIFTLLALVYLNVHRARALKLAFPVPPSHIAPRSPPPYLHPSSAVWSPWTPASPTSSMPPSLRAPSSLSISTLRASSRPTTPNGSPLLAPLNFSGPDDEDEESMFASHYMAPPVGNGAAHWSVPEEPAPSPQFLPAPGSNSFKAAERGSASWCWSWSFVLRGRRRRITLRIPTSLKALWLWTKASPDGLVKREGVWRGVARDAIHLAWPTVLFYLVLSWWMI